MAEREKLISYQLKEDKSHCLTKPLYLSMDIKLLPTTDDNEKIKAKIGLELQTNEQHQLFADLSHFLNLYLPKVLGNQLDD